MSRFTKAKIKRNCKHLNIKTVVTNVTWTCETTVQACIDCSKVLTEPKTDCR